MKLLRTLQPSVRASAARKRYRDDNQYYARNLFQQLVAWRDDLIAKNSRYPRLAPITFAQCLPASRYHQGMTRRELRNLRNLSGLKRPHQVRAWVDKHRRPA